MATESMAAEKVRMDRVSRGMKAERVFTVARKEFTDQVTGWRFLVILALFLAIALVGTYSGVGSYERDLDRYAQQLATMDNQNDGPAGMMPAKPPVEGVYSSMFRTLVSYRGLLALALTVYPVISFAVTHAVYADRYPVIDRRALSLPGKCCIGADRLFRRDSVSGKGMQDSRRSMHSYPRSGDQEVYPLEIGRAVEK